MVFVKDNYSSALLHKKSTSGKAGSQFITELLQETFEKFNLYDYKRDIHILTDGCPENKGEVLSWIKNIKAPPVVKKITAFTEEFPFSNSMSESTHKIYKTDFMKGLISYDLKAHLKSLDYFMIFFNHERLPCRILEHFCSGFDNLCLILFYLNKFSIISKKLITVSLKNDF